MTADLDPSWSPAHHPEAIAVSEGQWALWTVDRAADGYHMLHESFLDVTVAGSVDRVALSRFTGESDGAVARLRSRGQTE